MIPVEFDGFNVTYATDQPEYIPLPAWQQDDDPYGHVTTCWKLSWAERLKVLFGGHVWLMLLTFNKPIQPVILSTRWVKD